MSNSKQCSQAVVEHKNHIYAELKTPTCTICTYIIYYTIQNIGIKYCDFFAEK